LAHNYTGSFYLPNVWNITGLRWDMFNYYTEPTLLSVDLPDLEYIGGDLSLGGIPALRNVSMPKLKTVRSLVGMDYIYNADLRSLETAMSARFSGNMSR